MLELEGLHVGQRLRPVSVEVPRGTLLAVVGPNGAGKSTLIRAVLGLQPIDGGEVRVDGRSALALSSRDRAAYLGWLPQRSARAEGLTVLEVVAAARFRFRESRALSEERAMAALETAQVGELAHRRMTTLSGGERQRARLAGLIAQEADYWLLDEPGNHLDPAAQLEVWAGLAAQCAAGRGIVVVTHDVTLLGALDGVDAQVLALKDGQSAWCTSADDPELTDALGELLSLDLRRVEVDGHSRFFIAGPAR